MSRTYKRLKKDVETAKENGHFHENIENFKRRANLIKECESAKIMNRTAEKYTKEVA